MRYKHNLLQQLRGFCHAASAGSISKAARRMSLSQPSVSLQIQALERELGTALFERHGPRIRLTSDGETLLELARPLVRSMDNLEDDFAQRRDSITRGSVGIAAGGSTLQYILPPTIERFMREHPHIDLRLHNVTGRAGMALLRSGEVDIAVGPILEAPPDILFHPVVTYEPMLIARPDHPLAARKRITLKDVARYPLILPPRDQSTFRIVEMVFTEHSLQHDVKLEVGGYEVIKTYVKLGLGISIVMSHCISGDEGLFTAPLRRYFPCRSYGLVLAKGRTISPAAERFITVMCPDLEVHGSRLSVRARSKRGKRR